MGKITPESHGIESPALPAPHVCGRCRGPGDLLAPPLVLLLFHAAALALRPPGFCGIDDPLLDPSAALPFYLGALTLGLGHWLFYPARNPLPGRSAALFGLLALALGALGIATGGEPGGCIPTPGNPWISYPATFLALVSFGLSINVLAESLARRAQPAGPARWVLRTALGPALACLAVVVACWADGHAVLWGDALRLGLFGLVTTTMLAASPSGTLPRDG